MDAHEHEHGHAGVGHAQGFGGDRGARSLAIALILNAVYTVVEAIVGFTSGSLALVADAGHNFSDVLALGLALGAVWLAARPATANRSFGYKRAEILAAFSNALTLVVIAVLIFVEAARRFSNPPDVPGIDLIVLAAIGLAINAVGAGLVFRRGGENLNLRASFLHLAGDAHRRSRRGVHPHPVPAETSGVHPPPETTGRELLAATIASMASIASRTALAAQSPSAICFALAFNCFFVRPTDAGSITLATALNAWSRAMSAARRRSSVPPTRSAASSGARTESSCSLLLLGQRCEGMTPRILAVSS